MSVQSLIWLGARTPHFAELVALCGATLGLTVIRETGIAVWFQLGDGNELHVYA